MSIFTASNQFPDGIFVSYAMEPIRANVTNPAKMLAPALIEAMIIESLDKHRKEREILKKEKKHY